MKAFAVTPKVLAVLEKKLDKRNITDIELKANAIYVFRDYIAKQDWSQTFVEGPSALCDIGDDWQAALDIQSSRGTPDLILKNSRLGIDVSIGFRSSYNAILSGKFHDYITNANDESNLYHAILNLNGGVERTLEQHQAKLKEEDRSLGERIS